MIFREDEPRIPSTFCSATCPSSPRRAAALDLPMGQLHRVASERDSDEVDETKRNVLKLLAVAGIVGAAAGGLAGGTLQFLQPPMVGISSYPRVQLIDVDGSPLTVTKVESEYSVETSDDIIFYYPLRNEPNFFLNLSPANRQAPSESNPGAWGVPGGIGTNGSIVAFSAICQHLGCPAPAISYYPPGTCSQTFNTGPPSPNSSPKQPFYIHCSCHGSTYDPVHSAANLTGPAVLPLPQVVLDVDASGNIYAVGEDLRGQATKVAFSSVRIPFTLSTPLAQGRLTNRFQSTGGTWVGTRASEEVSRGLGQLRDGDRPWIPTSR